VLADRNSMCAMARSHAARQHPRLVPARTRPVRAAAATGIGAVAAFLAVLAAAPATPASAQTADQPPRVPLAIAVTSMSPAYARQGQTVTIKGEVKNLAATPATGLSVRLWSSRRRLGTRSQLENFATSNYLPPVAAVATAQLTRPQLGPGYTWQWTIRLPVKDLGLSCFGVYPLTIQVYDAAFQTARDQVPLPYWPAKPRGCATERRPKQSAVSWIWPLIDTPHQGVCAGLLNNNLAASIAPDGRLGSLLAAGSRYGPQAKLTWAIDPALLDSVRAMRGPYDVGASASCNAASEHPGSRAASRWLAEVIKVTAGQPVFLTPYADIDVAALAGSAEVSDVNGAFAAAGQVGRQILHRNVSSGATQAGSHQLSSIAWPADGIASRSALDVLQPHASTVVLAAPAASPVTYTPGAVTSKLTDQGKPLRVLLADSKITALLSSSGIASGEPGTAFGISQQYLAQTAMIVSEAPGINRPIVVAPPRHWNPSGQLANDLLADTIQAPWLRPITADHMATMRAEHLYPSVMQSDPGAERPTDLLSKINKLDHQIALLQSIRVKPDPALPRAVFGIESSAWHGNAVMHARHMLARTLRYVNTQLRGISLRGVGRHSTYHVTFGGKNSTINVVIHSQLHYTVRVALLVRSDKATVTGVPAYITVQPESYSVAATLTVHVHSQHGKIRLSLIAPGGSAMAGHPLPAYPLVIVVHPTDFGTIALGICAVALALFVIGSAFRAIRFGRPEPPGAGDDLDDGAGPPETDAGERPFAPQPGGHERLRAVDVAEPGPFSPAGEAVSSAFMAGEASPHPREAALTTGSWPGGLAESATELPARAEPHDGAPAAATARTLSQSGWIAPPGRSAQRDHRGGITSGGLPDLANPREYPDSVGNDRSDLAAAEPSVDDQEPASPGRRATEEHR
jgi:hypothetical protein